MIESVFWCVCVCAQAVSEAIQQTLTNTGMRIYGGHIYIAGGRISTPPYQLTVSAIE